MRDDRLSGGCVMLLTSAEAKENSAKTTNLHRHGCIATRICPEASTTPLTTRPD